MAKYCPLYGCKVLYLDCLECDERIECSRGNLSKMKKYKKVIIGIDQSYQNTGISICCDGKLKIVRSVQLDKYKSNSEKRAVLSKTLGSVLKSVIGKAEEIMCIIERIRLQSKGFLNINYIKSIGALNSVIVDKMSEYNVEVYSVDTRCWKSQVVGTSKPMPNKFGVPDEKWPTVNYIKKLGFEQDILVEITGRKEKGTFIRNGKKYMYNNDAADSACIALFGFVGEYGKLKLEE